MFKVLVDQVKCIGCSACNRCETFTMTEDGVYATPRISEIEVLDELHKEVTKDCPTNAISITEK